MEVYLESKSSGFTGLQWKGTTFPTPTALHLDFRVAFEPYWECDNEARPIVSDGKIYLSCTPLREQTITPVPATTSSPRGAARPAMTDPS